MRLSLPEQIQKEQTHAVAESYWEQKNVEHVGEEVMEQIIIKEHIIKDKRLKTFKCGL